MDRSTQENQEIERLIRAGDRARSSLIGEVVLIRARLDFPGRVRGSLKNHPFAWLVGATASATAFILLFRRRPVQVERKSRGFALTLLGLILTVMRPMMKIWLTGRFKDYLAGQLQGLTAGHPVARTYDSSNPL